MPGRARWITILLCLAAALLTSAPAAVRAAPPAARAAQPDPRTHSILLMMVDWTSPDGTPPSGAADLLTDQLDPWIAENSYGAVRTTGTATPWMRIPQSSCTDLAALRARAEAAAVDNGYDPSAYDTEIVYFPTTECGWTTKASGRRTVFVNGYLNVFSLAQAMGRALGGLADADALYCRDAAGRPLALGRNCTRQDGRDLFDPMGYDTFTQGSGAGHYNAAEKYRLGWLDGHVRTITRHARVTLRPYETPSNSMLAARVRTRGATYWLEYRQPIGADAYLADRAPGIVDGVLVHAVGLQRRGTDLLDMRPRRTLSGGTPDPRDAALPAGHRWRTPEGATIRVRWANARGARVVVHVPVAARR